MEDKIRYKIAADTGDFEGAKELFREYAASLGVDLSFQDFEQELQKINIQYNKPEGALLLASLNEAIVGCAGVRKLEQGIAELKRMYVKPGYRGYRIGSGLLTYALDTARELGYKKIRLDTLADMGRAQELYREFGFYTIPSYRFNPLKGTVYMEKDL